MPDTIAEPLAHQQGGVIPARVTRTEHPADERAGDPRPLRAGMETLSWMTMTSLDRRPGAGDAGRVTGERQDRPDPEVPEKAPRRTFTAQYNQEVLAAGRREGRGPAAGGPLLEPDQRVPAGPGRGRWPG
jgi:hypothetical protein